MFGRSSKKRPTSQGHSPTKDPSSSGSADKTQGNVSSSGAGKGSKTQSPGKKSPGSNPFSSMTASLPKNIFSSRSRRSSAGSPKDAPQDKISTLPNNSTSQSNSTTHLPMDTLQSSFTSAYANLGHSSGYNLFDSLGTNNVSSPGSSKSPFSSPTNSRTNSLTNVKALKDRYEREHGHGLFMGERSLDRQLDRLQMSVRGDISGTSPTASPRSSLGFSSNNKDRSLDREYPHMGARSLEREHQFGRSRSSERPDYTSQLYNSQEIKTFRDAELRGFRDALIMDFQAQITDLNKECAKMQQELDSTKDKLSSSMNSIKTFWSPELKKERALRKEESAKYCLLNEQLKVAQAEMKKQESTLHDMESQLCGCEDFQASSQISQHEIEILQREKDKQAKEIVILKKTVEEMELRIDTQKQTLSARDESMKKLLEMLQSKGLSNSAQRIEADREEIEKWQTHAIEGDRKVRRLQASVTSLEKEITQVKEDNSRLSDDLEQAKVQLKQQPASTHTMQAMLEAKDSRITALEREIQGLEDRLMKVQEEGAGTTEREKKDGSLKDSLSTKEKTLRNQIEHLKTELANKDTEIKGWKMKAETQGSQQAEHQQYIQLLKDQIAAKEKHIGMLQADMEDLRDRLKDKDSTIDRKQRHSASLQTEKRRIEGEISDLKDQIESRDRKITVLQNKNDVLEQCVDQKDEEILHLKTAASQALATMESYSSDSAISSMEESLNDKDRQIEKLKEQRERSDLEHQEECDMYQKSNQDLKNKLDQLQTELTDKQTELCELREQAAEVSTEKFTMESKIRQLQREVDDQTAQITVLKAQIVQLQSTSVADVSVDKQVTDMTSQVEQARNETNTAQAEINRLQQLLKEAEEDKEQKEATLKEQTEIIKEYKQKMGTLKRNKQAEKKKNAHLLEEARKREGDLSEDASQLQSNLQSKGERIEELEEALKESVKITAEREMVMVEQQSQLDDCKQKIEELNMELLRQKSLDNTGKMALLHKQLEEKDHKLKRLQSERHRHLEEVYEMKQEAIQAAISEKDANIALLEMTSTKKQRNTDEIDKLNKEKEKLQQQLKEVTQNRMKLIHKQERKKSPAHRSRGTTPEKADPHVLTAPGSLDPDCRATPTDSK